MINLEKLNLIGSICSIGAFLASSIGFGRGLLVPRHAFQMPSGPTRLYTILFLGSLGAVAFGVLWSLTERKFHWRFGAGGCDSLPQGWAAVALSATMTVPLILIPPLFQRLANVQVTRPRHFLAGAVVVILAALAHLFLYGSKLLGFAGARSLIFPLNTPPQLRRALLMELVYTCTHFCSIVLAYRIVVDSQFGPLDISVVGKTLLSAAVFFFGMMAYILLRYPESLQEKTWIQVRGVIAGILLMVTLTGGMLM